MSVDHADWSGLRDETDLSSLFPEAVEHKLTAPAHTGVAVLLHHSLFHRGTARLSDPSDDDPWRPMFKFIFNRTCAPSAPTWDTSGPPPDFAAAGAPAGMHGACRSLWRWLGGDDSLLGPVMDEAGTVQQLSATLTAEWAAGDEGERNHASYRLAELAEAGNTAAAEALLAAVVHPTCEGARRVAIHGLSAAGDPVVPGLLELLQQSHVDDEVGLRTMTYVADALGEAAEGAETWEAALTLLGDKQKLLDVAIAAGEQQVAASGGVPPTIPWHSPAPTSASKSVLHAVEHIGQRAVAARDARVCQLACKVLLRALAGPAASVAATAAASMTIADPALLGDAAAALLAQLRETAADGAGYRERAVATEALRRLVAPRKSTALAIAQRRVMQSLLEAEWAPPDEDPRQNGQIAGAGKALKQAAAK